MPLIAKRGAHSTFEQEELAADGARRGDARAGWRSGAVSWNLSTDHGQYVIGNGLPQSAELLAPRAIGPDADGKKEWIAVVAHGFSTNAEERSLRPRGTQW